MEAGTPPRNREPLNVLIYGDDWAPAGSWIMGQAYVGLGHRIRYYSPVAGLEAYRKFPWRIYGRLTRSVRERDRRRHAAGLVDAARDHAANIVIILKGLLIGPSDVAALRTAGAWVVNYNYDDYFTTYRSGWSHLQRAALPHYDLLVCTKQYNVAEVQPYNPKAVFILHAYEPSIHRPVPVPDSEKDRWGVDVVFVGQWAESRGTLLDRIVREVPARYAIYGSGWNNLSRRSPVRPFLRHTEIYGDALAKALGGAKVALGFLRKENRDDYTTRTFEIPACRGVLLGERTPMHQSLFREGIEAEFFDPDRPDELVEKLRLLLRDDGRRERMRAAGLAAVRRGDHTYENRVRTLLDYYDTAKGRPAGPEKSVGPDTTFVPQPSVT